MRPSSLEVLDLTLPVVADPELETLIETRVGQLCRQLSSTSSLSGGSRGELGVRFLEKRRRKASGLGGWLTGTGRSEEEICWEAWKMKVTLTTPRTEAGKTQTLPHPFPCADVNSERMTLLRAEAPALHRTAMTIVNIVNRDKDRASKAYLSYPQTAETDYADTKEQTYHLLRLARTTLSLTRFY